MVKPVGSVDWERVARLFKEKGCNFSLDKKPMPTGSGYINGYWFNFFWFEDSNGVFSIALERIPEMCSSWKIAVDIFSEVVFGGRKPCCRFTRVSEEGNIVNFRWSIAEPEVIAMLASDPNIQNLRDMNGKNLK